MSLLRFVMLLALGVWIGGIVFFGAVLAPTVFSVLPTRAMAGSVVNRSLLSLHVIGIVCGVLFLLTSMLYSYLSGAGAQPLAPRHVLVVVMLLMTAYAQFGLGSKMNRLRTQMGQQLDMLPKDDPTRVSFNRMHIWSTRIESSVLFLGLGVLYLTSRRLS